MKKVLPLLLTMILLIGVITIPAQAASDGAKIKVDGEIVSLVAYNIRDNNYFKLRDIANILKGTEAQFDVLWNAEVGAIEIVPDKDYSTVEEITSEKIDTPKIVKSSAKIFLNGKLTLLNAYNINGNTFFKLRDIADVIDFGIEWNASENVIEIDSSASYVYPEYEGDRLALNQEYLSLINKDKAYIDSKYTQTSMGYGDYDYIYGDFDTIYTGQYFTATYEEPAAPNSRVNLIDISLYKLFHNCPEELTLKDIESVFEEYKYGIIEKDNVPLLIANYCGYELCFWYTEGRNLSKYDTAYLDVSKAYTPDEKAKESPVNFIGYYTTDDWVEGSYIEVIENGASYTANLLLVRGAYIWNGTGKVIGDNKMHVVDENGDYKNLTFEWINDNEVLVKCTDKNWQYFVSSEPIKFYRN